MRISKIKINYEIKEGKDPILILHGWGSNLKRWKKVAHFLNKKGFKIILLDLPGFGKSKEPNSIWGYKEYTAFLLSFLKKLNLDKINLVGHSLGGSLSIKLASENPQLVKKLVLISPGFWGKTSLRGKLLWKGIHLSYRLFSYRWPREKIFPFFNEKIKKLTGRPYYLAQGKMIKIFEKLIQTNINPLISKIKAKTLIIWGEKDFSPLENAFLIKNLIGEAEIKILKGVGHSPHRFLPRKLAKLIENFLKNES